MLAARSYPTRWHDRAIDPISIETRRGTARAHLTAPPAPAPVRGALVLGHGAGGGVGAPDLQAARRAGLAAGYAVALVEQPYRVAGRRAPPPAAHADEAWVDVVTALRADRARMLAGGLPLVTGGRSFGARVACRTAAAVRAAGVLCLAFPLVPPAGAGPTRRLPPSRLPELEAVPVPLLVVQGRSDRFGLPPQAPGRTVALVDGDHSLRSAADAVAAEVEAWLLALH